MGRIHIESLVVSGVKGESRIEFGKNLTIITGPSDTGKSYIFKCIDYIFGAKKDKLPFEKTKGFDTITATFTNDEGYAELTRKFESNKIQVKTNINGLDSKSYDVKNKNFDNYINKVFLKLIGINEQIKVPKNESGEMVNFSWRSIKHAFMVHEDDTEQERAILLPKENTSTTSFLAGLLYILYKQDFSEYDEESSKKTKNIRKAAVQKYITLQKEGLEQKRTELTSRLSITQNNDLNIEEIISELEKEFETIEARINSALEVSQNVSKDIYSVQSKIQRLSVALNRYNSLESQYTSDIKRLTFIVNNQELRGAETKNQTCPFCEHPINPKDHSSYLESAKIELSKTVSNIDNLSKAKDAISTDLNDAEIELTDLKREKNELVDSINKDLIPAKRQITDKLKLYTEIIEINNELSLIEKMNSQFDADLKNLDTTVSTQRLFKPKDLFEESFINDIPNNYLNILRSIKYEPVANASFDMSNFDIVLNDSAKNSHGKGYRALLNSTLFLSLREYVNEKAEINPHFYFIDSPLHGLSIPENKTAENNVRNCFFDYLSKHTDDDQIIIIENSKSAELPEENDKTKIIEFTQDINNGRYGFLVNTFKE